VLAYRGIEGSHSVGSIESKTAYLVIEKEPSALRLEVTRNLSLVRRIERKK
jgi:hypothetical protein